MTSLNKKIYFKNDRNENVKSKQKRKSRKAFSDKFY